MRLEEERRDAYRPADEGDQRPENAELRERQSGQRAVTSGAGKGRGRLERCDAEATHEGAQEREKQAFERPAHQRAQAT